MDSERPVDQLLGVGDPVTIPDIDQVVNDTQPGSPPNPVPVDSTDPSVGDSMVLDDASAVNDEEPIDCEVPVPSRYMADLLIDPTLTPS
uniref:Gag-pol polyprotein n=1 Tax=Haemonchus contortus TaxID=6289 RepID=A0A7I4Z278_HAECO